jgi:ATP-binding cassette subfamily B multidrug efflux pump
VARPLVSTAHDLIKNQIIGAPVSNRVRWLTHRYVLRQSLSFFQNDFAGRVANKIMQAAPALRDSVVQLIDAIWYAAVQWVGAAVVFAAADWRLLVPLVLWLAAYFGALFYFVPRIKARSTEAAEARSALVGRIVDSYTNILTVKLFAHAEREDTYARAGLLDQMTKYQASLRLQTSMELVLYTLNGFLMVSATALAVYLWSEGLVTIGAIAAVTGLVLRIIGMSGWILWVVAGIFENIGVVQEGMDTISRPNDVVDIPDSRPLVVRAGEIRFDKVSFHYGRILEAGTGRRGGVIHDFSLLIKPGEKVGVVGRSGAGKSTLVNLLLRFYDLESGRILIDGQDIAHVTQDSLRAQRHGDAGHLAAAPLRPRQHPLWPPRGGRDRGHRRGPQGAGARLHRRARGSQGPPGLLGPRRRARGEALGRAAAAYRHCPRAAEGRADPDPRRGHQRARLGGGAGHPGAAL